MINIYLKKKFVIHNSINFQGKELKMKSENCFNEDEYDEMTRQIIDILLNFPRLDISGDKGMVIFLTKDFAEEVHIFDKIFPYADGQPEYVFVFKGYYILEQELPENIPPKKFETREIGRYHVTKQVGAEGTVPEYDEIKKQIVRTLNDQPPKKIKGENGSISIGDPINITITIKISSNNNHDSYPQYVFNLPAFYSPK